MRNVAEEHTKIAFTWACQQATIWGWTWSYEHEMIWVKTNDSEIGCDGRMDFVALVSEHNEARFAK
jgi:hypothetical protein